MRGGLLGVCCFAFSFLIHFFYLFLSCLSFIVLGCWLYVAGCGLGLGSWDLGLTMHSDYIPGLFSARNSSGRRVRDRRADAVVWRLETYFDGESGCGETVVAGRGEVYAGFDSGNVFAIAGKLWRSAGHREPVDRSTSRRYYGHFGGPDGAV